MSENEVTTEDLILKAAEEEFLTKGFNGARTTSIAERAGVTHAMLHYYFRTKEKLYAKVFESKINGLLSSVVDAIDFTDTSLSATAQIENLMRRHYDFVSANQRIPIFVINELLQNPDRSKDLKKLIQDKLMTTMMKMKSHIDTAIAMGEIAEIDFFTLISDIAALNLFAIISKPLVLPMTGMDSEAYDKWRIEENIKTIKARIA